MRKFNPRSSESKLSRAFKQLRKVGYFARQNFWCCQSCAWYDIEQKGKGEKAVFFHQQDNQQRQRGVPFYLAWSGDGQEIVDVLRRNGIDVNWEGNENSRIQISNYD